MDYKEFLNSEYVINSYKKIEYLKRDFPVNHGFVHINHVIENAKEISKKLGFSPNERELLLIAATFHDTGYLMGRDEHAKNGAILTLGYLTENSDLELEDIKRICKAIASHGGFNKEDYLDNVSMGLILADKMDFVKTRYDKYLCSYVEKYKPFLEIDAVKLKKIGDGYEVVIESADDKLEEKIIDRSIYKKLNEIIDNINNYTNYHIDLKFASNNANPDIKL